MDPFSHGLVGAAASSSAAEQKKLRPAVAAGFISALLADLDIFIDISSDPLFNIEVHRQFTHSLVFIPVGALVATVLLWWFLKKYLTLKELYMYSLLGYATAGLLDAFTSYGTQLLWPFSDTRFAWNLVSVVDPFVTVGLIVFMGLAVYKKNRLMAWFAWGWLILLLFTGWVQNQRGLSAIENIIEERGHQPEEIVIKPTIGNQVLWRTNYIYNKNIYTDAVRVGPFSSPIVYEGDAQPKVDIKEEFLEYRGTTLYNDLQRFYRLSEGYLIRHPEKPEIIGDARYSMLPTTLIPLWGVEIDTTDTDRHLPFLYFRDAGEEIRGPFIDMIFGRPLSKIRD